MVECLPSKFETLSSTPAKKTNQTKPMYLRLVSFLFCFVCFFFCQRYMEVTLEYILRMEEQGTLENTVGRHSPIPASTF
jgi:hypothetical protein